MRLEARLRDQRYWPQIAEELWAKGISPEFNAAAWGNQPFWHWFNEEDAKRRPLPAKTVGTWVDWALVGGAVFLAVIALLTLSLRYPARYSIASETTPGVVAPAQKAVPSRPGRPIRTTA